MKKVLIILGLLAAVGLIIAAVVSLSPGDRSEPAPTASTASDSEYLRSANKAGEADLTGQAEVSIDITNYTYTPTIVTISRGTTVTWTNRNQIRHNVEATDGSFVSPLLSKDQSYSHTFNETGNFRYFCQPHPVEMRAIINVID